VLDHGLAGHRQEHDRGRLRRAACRRSKRALIFCYEESASQVIRNMASVGLDLAPWVENGNLRIQATRPTLQGLEQHLVEMHDMVKAFRPAIVVVDPISNLSIADTGALLKATLMRLIDFLKDEGITGVFTSLTSEGPAALAESQVGISSLMDTWLLLANLEANGERTRTIQVLKSRGMPHSNQVREFVLGTRGVELVDVYMPGDRVMRGAERVAHSGRAREAAAAEARTRGEGR
jgi:circadian clock protein KaiC